MNKYDGHTPGPWKWVPDGHNGGYWGLFSNAVPVVVPQGEYLESWIATDVAYYGETALEAADAHLIADAPMLLQQRDQLMRALGGLIEAIEDLSYECNTFGDSHYVVSARELITRIREEETK